MPNGRTQQLIHYAHERRLRALETKAGVFPDAADLVVVLPVVRKFTPDVTSEAALRQKEEELKLYWQKQQQDFLRMAAEEMRAERARMKEESDAQIRIAVMETVKQIQDQAAAAPPAAPAPAELLTAAQIQEMIRAALADKAPAAAPAPEQPKVVAFLVDGEALNTAAPAATEKKPSTQPPSLPVLPAPGNYNPKKGGR